MKKLACILLSVLMLLTLGVNAFAAVEGEDDANLNTEQILGSGSLGGEVDDGELGAGDIFGYPTVKIENTTAYQGKSVTVDLVITENPGFTDMTVAIAGTGLTVTAVANGDAGTATLSGGNVVITSGEEITEDVCIAKVTLTVGDDLGDIEATISVTATNGQTAVTIKGAEFTVTVEEASAVEGDVNGDGECNISDLSVLKLYLAGAMTLESPEIVNPDVNMDGDNNSVSDLAALKLILART